MSRALLFLALASLCACKKKPAPPVEPAAEAAAAPLTGEAKKNTWTVYSQDGRSSVIQSYRGPGSCHVESAGAGAAWTVDQCLSDTMQLQFVSNDGKKLLVIDPMPETQDSWRTTPVVWLYDSGKQEAFTTAGALVRDDKKLDVVGHRFAWLAGASGQPGIEPKYAEVGFVDGATVSGDAFHFGFDGSGIPPPLEAPALAAPGGLDCGGMMEFTDNRGETHFVDNVAAVPPRYRKSVHCTRGAEIATVQHPKLPAMVVMSAKGVQRVGEATPAPAPAPPAKGATIYCSYNYLAKGSNSAEVRHRGPGYPMKASYCTHGTVEEATADCNKRSGAEPPGAAGCACTDDQTFIGTRCD